MSQTGRRLAILIGSSQFEKEPLKTKPLKCPERDVDGMHELLASAEHGAYGEVFVFKNSQHQAALDQIEEVLTDAARDDQVLIYYSGHGETDLPGRLYLTATNTDTKKLVSTSIPVETLRVMIENSACRKIILILDCCFGGAAGKSFVKSSVGEKLKELARVHGGHGVYILTASTAAQTAQEREGDDYGLLTKHIIAGIKDGAAANDDGVIHMDGLYRYVFAKVTGEGYQEPMRWALNVKGEELVIARAAAVYSAERLQAFRKLISKLEDEQELEDELCDQARQVIRENQPKRDKKLFELLDQLQKGMKPGIFSSQWMKAFVAPSPLGSQLEAKPIKQPKVTLANQAPTQSSKVNTLVELIKDVPSVSMDVFRRAAGQMVEEFIVDPSDNSLSQPTDGGTTNATVTGFTDDLNGVKLEMIYVPSGKFMMGGDKYDDEKPRHEVTVPAFYIGKFQVTQAQWKAVMGDKLKPSFKGDDLPMESVLWEDAKEFCKKLTQMTNKAYRLPTEAEWEYACRAGTTGDYAGKLDEMAWYGDNSGKTRIDALKLWNSDSANYGKRLTENGNQTHPVGEKKPNAFGLYDMHGNVWEWCEDVWHDSYKGAPTDGSAWLSGGDSARRVVRGGSWNYDQVNCRSADRSRDELGYRDSNIGFRVVVSART